jgi:peptidoglycan/LPS O-acetylase OafA/YrhL
VSGRRPDRVSLVAGLAVCGLGLVVLLDRVGAIDLHFGYGLPLILACVGAVMLAAGLDGRRDR